MSVTRPDRRGQEFDKKKTTIGRNAQSVPLRALHFRNSDGVYHQLEKAIPANIAHISTMLAAGNDATVAGRTNPTIKSTIPPLGEIGGCFDARQNVPACARKDLTISRSAILRTILFDGYKADRSACVASLSG